MGGMGGKVDSQQVLIVGLEKSGKSLFLKKLNQIKKNDTEEANLKPTIGYNFITISYNDTHFDVWDLGGDPTSRSFWSTFYRNLKFTIVVYIINLFDSNSHLASLRELLILINQEELKQARFFIIFNLSSDEAKKITFNDPNVIKENREIAEDLLTGLRECPIHDYDTRVFWDIIDISKMKAGENKTDELLRKCLIGNKDKGGLN
jgi:GTPase SAR1 family protein